MYRVVDSNFYGSLSYLYITGNPAYTVPGGAVPNPQFFAYLINGNPIITVFINISIALVFIGSYLVYLPWISRVFFAMSFDRMLPSWFADVSTRFSSPVKALAIAGLGCIITLYFWTYGFASAILNGAIILSIIYLLGGVAAVAVPYTMKDVFAGSPMNYRVGGIPVISIVGVVMIISWGYTLWAALTTPALGVLSVPAYTLTVGLFLSGLIFYFIAKAYWKSKGVDVTIAFKQIPPE